MVARRAARWVERRLGAILAADVAGYSRLTRRERTPSSRTITQDIRAPLRIIHALC
jgi:hypothetical protein